MYHLLIIAGLFFILWVGGILLRRYQSEGKCTFKHYYQEVPDNDHPLKENQLFTLYSGSVKKYRCERCGHICIENWALL